MAEVSIVCNPTGNVWTGAQENGSTVKIKKLETAYAEEPSPITDPIDIYSKKAFVERFGKDRAPHTVVIQHGQIVYKYERPTVEYTLWFDAVKWLEMLVADSDTNFLLEFGHDFILYKTLMELNFLIKEDTRFQENKDLMEDAWETLVDWDSRLVSPTETEVDL